MSYLIHHGVKGQKWGVRRYQNEDGSLTLLGKKEYGVLEGLPKDEIEYIINKDAKRTTMQILGSAATFASANVAVSKFMSENGEVKIDAIPGAVINAGIAAAFTALAMKLSRTKRLEAYRKKFERQQSNK